MISSYNIMFSQSQQDAIKIKGDINSNLQIAATLDKEEQKKNPSYNSQVYYLLLLCKVENRMAMINDVPDYNPERVQKYLDLIINKLIKHLGNNIPTNLEIFIKPLMMKAHFGLQMGIPYPVCPLNQAKAIVENLYGTEPEIQYQILSIEYLKD